jgi:hypothetical protein
VEKCSEVGVIAVYVLSSVARSIVEKVSSPTLLMRDVMRTVRDVVGRDVVVAAGLAAATVVNAADSR